MTVHKHNIHRYSHFVKMTGHGLVHPHGHHHLHNEHLSHHLKHLHLGRGTVAKRHEDYDSEPEGAIIHNRNGRHHKERQLVHRHRSIRPLHFKI